MKIIRVRTDYDPQPWVKFCGFDRIFYANALGTVVVRDVTFN